MFHMKKWQNSGNKIKEKSNILPLTTSQLRKKLRELDQKELIELIA